MNRTTFSKIVKKYLYLIYGKKIKLSEINKLFVRIESIFSEKKKKLTNELWNQKDIFLITYADSIKKDKQKNFKTLSQFLNVFCREFEYIHLLPFFPFSSDDGFAVKDYKKISIEHGDWSDFKKIAKNFKIIIDLVINHCSAENYLFKNFLDNKEPGKNFFIVNDQKFKESVKIIRPRSSELSKKIQINGKYKYVWCTFSHDQVDLNFRNTEVLIFFLEIIKFYLDNNSKALRLDAVAFLWKEIGTRCINLPQTHDIIRLIRIIIEYYYNNILIITETNIPSHENLSYFGNNNEAHCIYNFSLAPLLIHSIVKGSSFYLKKWSRSMPPAQENNSYLNFLSTHDGIGFRPLEGILPSDEIQNYINFLKKQGALLSYRKDKKKESVYEVNITLLDAFKQTFSGNDSFNIDRFLLAHSILLSIEGIPAIYIQNLLGSRNDNIKVKNTGHNRSINRKNWDYDDLKLKLKKNDEQNYLIYNSLIKLIKIRKKQPAFHPNATQFTLQLDDDFFGIWRQSLDKSQSIFCINNLTKFKKKISLLDINLISTDSWFDLISKKKLKSIDGELIFSAYQTYWISNKRNY